MSRRRASQGRKSVRVLVESMENRRLLSSGSLGDIGPLLDWIANYTATHGAVQVPLDAGWDVDSSAPENETQSEESIGAEGEVVESPTDAVTPTEPVGPIDVV